MSKPIKLSDTPFYPARIKHYCRIELTELRKHLDHDLDIDYGHGHSRDIMEYTIFCKKCDVAISNTVRLKD